MQRLDVEDGEFVEQLSLGEVEDHDTELLWWEQIHEQLAAAQVELSGSPYSKRSLSRAGLALQFDTGLVVAVVVVSDDAIPAAGFAL